MLQTITRGIQKPLSVPKESMQDIVLDDSLEVHGQASPAGPRRLRDLRHWKESTPEVSLSAYQGPLINQQCHALDCAISNSE